MRLTFAVVLVAAVAALAGCGGGGGGDRLSKEEFQQRADAICAKYDTKIQALGSPSSPEDIPQFLEKGIPLIQQGIAELRALKPPEDLEQDYEAMLDETEKAIPAARKLGEAAKKQDAAAVQEALAEGERADSESDRLATKLGLDECAAD
jgi:hypothetical protein